jgi:hypothetical protein
MGVASARLRRLLTVSATVSLGGLAVAALHHVLHDVSYRGLIDSLAAMSSWVIVGGACGDGGRLRRALCQ